MKLRLKKSVKQSQKNVQHSQGTVKQFKQIKKQKNLMKKSHSMQRPKKRIRSKNSPATESFHRSLLVFSILVIMVSHYFMKNRMIIIMLSIIALTGGTYAFVQLTRGRGQSLKHTLGVLSLAFVIVIGFIFVVAIIFFVIVL